MSRPLSPTEAILMIATSEVNSDLYYATRFLAPDPFIFLWCTDEKVMVMSDLELDRAKAQARVDSVLSYSEYEERARKSGTLPDDTLLNVVDCLLKEKGVSHLRVPASCGIAHADGLRQRGYTVTSTRDPFFEERVVKTEEEIAHITESLRHTEAAIDRAIQVLRQAEIRNGYLYKDGRRLTSEEIKKTINVTLMENGCVAEHTIVACGRDGCDPHNEGSGELRAHESIVMDVFPRASATRYFGDITRTVVRGRASEKLTAMYEAVRQGQETAFRMIREGVQGEVVHAEVTRTLEKHGFSTGLVDGRVQGFFHGTGHGLGLDVHEPPRISKVPWTLKAGNVVTVEPGLYYLDAGAVRIEDVVVVTKTGCRNLVVYPKQLEI